MTFKVLVKQTLQLLFATSITWRQATVTLFSTQITTFITQFPRDYTLSHKTLSIHHQLTLYQLAIHTWPVKWPSLVYIICYLFDTKPWFSKPMQISHCRHKKQNSMEICIFSCYQQNYCSQEMCCYYQNLSLTIQGELCCSTKLMMFIHSYHEPIKYLPL